MSLPRLVRWACIGAAIVVVCLVCCGCGRRNPVLVKVSDNGNSEDIKKDRYFARLERVYGAKIMDQLVEETTVELYAKKIGVMPTTEELNVETEELKKVTKNLDETLRANGIHPDEWKRQTQIAMIKRRILTEDVQVTDDEVKKLYEQAVAGKASPIYTYGTLELLLMRFTTKDAADKAYKDLEDGARWAAVAQKTVATLSEEMQQRAMQPSNWRIDGKRIIGAVQGPSGPMQIDLFGNQANTDAVLATAAGKYTKPIMESSEGRQVWAIVMVSDKVKAETLSFAQAKYITRNAALEQKAQQGGKAQEAAAEFEKFKKSVDIKPFDPRFATMKQAGAGAESKEAAKTDAKKKPKADAGG